MARKRRVSLFFLFFAAGILSTACDGPSPEPSRPESAVSITLEGRSVVVFMVDTLRADFLGAYGFDGDISPNLDRFAEESVVFERCVAPAPWTVPSVASLFLSTYPQAHGVVKVGKAGFIDGASGAYQTSVLPDEATLAEVLRSAGYATAAFVENSWVGPRQGFDRGFDHFFVESRPVDPLLPPAFDWLATVDGQPFFLYLHSMTVHGPYKPKEQDVEILRNAAGLGPSKPLTEEQMDSIIETLRMPAWAKQPAARDIREWRLRYGAQVRQLDREFAELLEGLRRAGRLEDTIIIVVSDHGEALGEHDGWHHGDYLYDHQLHVPLMIRVPGLDRGARIDQVVSLVDVWPTLAEALSIPAGEASDGSSLMPLIVGAGGAGDARLVYASGVKSNTRMRAIVGGRYKLIHDDAAETTRLFDTRADPGELEDLAAENPDLVASWLERLRGYEQAVYRPASESETTEIPEELAEKLKSLGYLN